MSLEAYDNELQKLRARGCEPDMELWKLRAVDCVPALEKKQLADWAVTTFNKNWNRNKEGPNSANYLVWIQPSSEVPHCCLRP